MGRNCTVCVSPRRSAIDAQLAGGEPLAAVARRYKLNSKALGRHRNAHLSKAIVAIAIEKYGLESAASAYESTVLRLEGLVDRLEGLLSVAEDRKSLIGGANVAREIRSSLELIARLRGELDTRPVHTTVNVLATPEFVGVVSRLIEALAPYPEARLAAAEVLDVEEVS
jgi:hypothetical protein